MIIIGRHINGITLNDLEYILDGSGEVMEFENMQRAKDFLDHVGYPEEDRYYLVFKDSETDETLNYEEETNG